METKTLKSWEGFEDELVRINAETIYLRKKTQRYVVEPFFRGHGCSEWPLETTLDRIQKGMSVSDYYRIIESVQKHVATCTSEKWDLNTEIKILGFKFRAPEFLAYLRHNGFPSPLLDWTRSPYIAAYFAFRDVSSPRQQQEYVSIFVYREFAGKSKFVWGDKAHICVPGSNITTHRNHYLQQSEYLFCVKEESKDKWFFANFEDVPPHEGQDDLVKYNIPISEQQKVLRKLDSMNITAYSLFNSEPALMETLALREIILE